MATIAATRGWTRGPWASATIVGGSIAGALDIIYALGAAAWQGNDPTNILLAISSGIMGADAFTGGPGVAAMGMALHFAMTMLMAGIFVTAIRLGLDSLRRNPWLSGPLYGVGIYFVMYSIVLPLSLVPMRDPRPPIDFLNLAVHMFLVGLPIALAATHWLSGNRFGRAAG